MVGSLQWGGFIVPHRHIKSEQWRFLDATFSEYHWYRRLRGGHWERWYFRAPINAFVWVPVVGGCWRDTGKRPANASGFPVCE